ncbi:MAG: OsmC family protein [Planctomycetota bacterium]|jgi:organic hydroperoxide reductase OsmC/OhrA
MSEHFATIEWSRTSPDFTYQTYNRDHAWRFDGGSTIEASATPEYKGNPALVDPEEAFIASLSACHMLTFLALATKKHLVVNRYADEAVGHLEKNAEGRMAITRVVLRPRIEFDEAPSAADLHEMHEGAHKMCFIANSVSCEITVEEPTGAPTA